MMLEIFASIGSATPEGSAGLLGAIPAAIDLMLQTERYGAAGLAVPWLDSVFLFNVFDGVLTDFFFFKSLIPCAAVCRQCVTASLWSSCLSPITRLWRNSWLLAISPLSSGSVCGCPDPRPCSLLLPSITSPWSTNWRPKVPLLRLLAHDVTVMSKILHPIRIVVHEKKW